MLGLQRPSGKQAAEIKLSGVIELAAIDLSDVASRDDQGQHLRIHFFRIRTKRRAGGDLVGLLTHTTSHTAASTILSATAAGCASGRNLLARSHRLCRNRRANDRHTRTHGEQSDDEGTGWLRLAVHGFSSIRQETADSSMNPTTTGVSGQ